MSKVALLFPTGTDPRSPYLALPCLAAALRHHSVEVSLQDLDIGGMLALLEPGNLAKAGSIFAANQLSAGHPDAASAHLVAAAETLAQRVPRALQIFRDPELFFNPNEFNAARDTVFDGLDVCSAALDSRVHYSIDPVRYDIDGFDLQKLADLISATADDRFNLFAEYWERVVFPRLVRENPLFAGITITNRQQLLPGLMLARRLRQRGHFVVLGGALIAKFLQRLVALPEFFNHFADAVIGYEGEAALLGLVEELNSDGDLSRVPNLLYLEKGSVRTTPVRVEDVNELPTPDFEGMPLGSYLTPYPVLPVYFGKGCYFNRCKFCDIPFINHVSKKRYRIRTVERVVQDLLTLKRRFGCRHFEFTDEALPPQLLAQLAEALGPHRRERLQFVGYARLEPGFNREVCHKLAEAGFRKLFFGLESGSQDTLDHMDKGIQVADAPMVLNHCREAGIRFHLFSIIGFPEETPERAGETLRFFEENMGVIDHPGNSFDIHQFGLELRTAYAAETERYGVSINRDALAKDFVIGVGREWSNPRGLSLAETDFLIQRFNQRLRELYRQSHAGLGQLWPAFEEFSLLYCDHYGEYPFPFRASLPDGALLSQYGFRWNPATVLDQAAEGHIWLRSRHGKVGMTEASFELLTGLQRAPLNGVLQAVCRSVDEVTEAQSQQALRSTLDEWLACGLIQLEPLIVIPDPLDYEASIAR